ncbi:conserved hypothetical protein [Flavobacterium sp. 9R]|uniref:hypothetical protein n=1 Tax=Flavobacterium sp. 9R TaxID=2653143 RepID=UPI0012F381B6|nr:hypothetical protein [Flavobacterium sp. 9R]VXB59133.1 conserved hypothetical protein [Flavobacterium sp. 9R]
MPEKLLDTINMTQQVIPVKIISDTNKFDWEPYVLIVATLSLVAAVIIPFAQKWYEEFRTKRSFQFYFKKQLGIILNLLTTQKIEYIKPSVKDNPEKQYLTPTEFSRKLEADFKEHKEALQPRTIFSLLMNLQQFMQYVFQLRYSLTQIDFEKLTERTLEHGKELSKEELQKAYGIILIYESFISISLFHDRFGEMKTIKRELKDNVWVGLKLDKDFLQNQNLLNQDLLHLNNNEQSISEITQMVRIVENKTKEYFDFDNLQKRRATNNNEKV